MYNFSLTDCVQNNCTGDRINVVVDSLTGGTSGPISFVWILQGNTLQLSFAGANSRIETFTINEFFEDQHIIELSSIDFNSTQFIKCGSDGFPLFLSETFGCYGTTSPVFATD